MSKTHLTVLALAIALPGAALAGDGYQRRSDGEIQFDNYPSESLRRGEEGVVGIRVRLDRQGRLRSCEVAKSSGYAALDAASCDLLIAHARMKPFLNGDGRKIEKETTGQVVWKLPADRAAKLVGVEPAAFTTSKGRLARAADKVICRTLPTTGSLVTTKKTCLTGQEWARQYRQAQEETQDMKPKAAFGG